MHVRRGMGCKREKRQREANKRREEKKSEGRKKPIGILGIDVKEKLSRAWGCIAGGGESE